MPSKRIIVAAFLLAAATAGALVARWWTSAEHRRMQAKVFRYDGLCEVVRKQKEEEVAALQDLEGRRFRMRWLGVDFPTGREDWIDACFEHWVDLERRAACIVSGDADCVLEVDLEILRAISK